MVPLLLVIDKELLLRAENRPGTGDAVPSNKILRHPAVVFHSIEPDQCACSTKAGFAVDSDPALLGLGDFYKLGDDVGRWDAAICEEEVVVLDSTLCESLLIVSAVIKTYYRRNPNFLKDRYVIVRCEVVVAVVVGVRVRRVAKGKEFSWNNPIHISIVNLLPKFIILTVESLQVKPTYLNGLFQRAKTVPNNTLVSANPLACIPKRGKRLGWCQPPPAFVCTPLQHQDLVRSHKICRVCFFRKVGRAEMIDLIICKFRIG
jgi:hypothetical protein